METQFVVEGFIIGMHKSPYHGFSVEFSEHRPYGLGDEIKFIDWKLLARTDRLYIKQFEEETNFLNFSRKSIEIEYTLDSLEKSSGVQFIISCVSIFIPMPNIQSFWKLYTPWGLSSYHFENYFHIT